MINNWCHDLTGTHLPLNFFVFCMRRELLPMRNGSQEFLPDLDGARIQFLRSLNDIRMPQGTGAASVLMLALDFHHSFARPLHDLHSAEPDKRLRRSWNSIKNYKEATSAPVLIPALAPGSRDGTYLSRSCPSNLRFQ